MWWEYFHVYVVSIPPNPASLDSKTSNMGRGPIIAPRCLPVTASKIVENVTKEGLEFVFSFMCLNTLLTDLRLVVLIIFADGFIKPHTPGSLREPAETFLFPSNWLTLPLSFGLLMSPWGGHSVFPNIYRDMRHPHKFPKAVKTTFTFTVSHLFTA